MSNDDGLKSTGNGDKDDPSGAQIETPVDRLALRDSLLDLWRRLPAAVLRTTLAIDGLFLAFYVLVMAFAAKDHYIVVLLGLEGEGNVPTWWYGSQQLLVAIVFLLLASGLFSADQRLRPLRPLFIVSGLGFGFISLDEVGEVHEIGSRILGRVKEINVLEQQLVSALHIKHRVVGGGGLWIPLYTVIGIAMLVWLVPQVVNAFRVWPKQVTTVAIGFGVFAFSAAVLQVVGYFFKPESPAHNMYVFVEQGLKMVGISIALYGAVQVFAAGADLLTRRLAGTPEGGSSGA